MTPAPTTTPQPAGPSADPRERPTPPVRRGLGTVDPNWLHSWMDRHLSDEDDDDPRNDYPARDAQPGGLPACRRAPRGPDPLAAPRQPRSPAGPRRPWRTPKTAARSEGHRLRAREALPDLYTDPEPPDHERVEDDAEVRAFYARCLREARSPQRPVRRASRRQDILALLLDEVSGLRADWSALARTAPKNSEVGHQTSQPDKPAPTREPEPEPRWISSNAAARLLRVRKADVYALVDRGLTEGIARRTGGGQRRQHTRWNESTLPEWWSRVTTPSCDTEVVTQSVSQRVEHG